MSKEFYNYLAERTVEFFDTYSVKSGDKFILHLDSQKDVENFYSSLEVYLKAKNIAITYKRQDEEVFETVSFNAGADKSIVLIVVPEIDITNAYLTRIRNTVKEGEAILIVCFNPIDSIAGGTESLQKEGMPFHKAGFTDWIRNKITDSALLSTEKAVLLFNLEKKQSNDDMDMYSINDYASVLSVLHNGQISDNDFKRFGLFSDSELNTITFSSANGDKEIVVRINDNYDLFKKVDNIVRYGNYEDDLDNLFISTFITNRIGKNIKEYGAENWDKGITFNEAKEARKKKENQEKLKLTSTDVFADDTSLILNKDFFVRSNKETESGQRKRNILIFNANRCKKILISVGTSEYLGSKPEITTDKNDNVLASVSGKKINIEVTHSNITISKVKVKCSENFEINFCIIDSKPDWFMDITSRYLISGTKSTKKQKALIINCSSDEIIFNRRGSEDATTHLEPDIEIIADEDVKLVLTIDDDSFNDNEAMGTISIDGITVPVLFKNETPNNSSITGVKIVQLKLANCQSFKYYGDNKLTFGTNEYNAREDLRENLEIEQYIINNNCLSCTISDGIFDNPLNVSASLKTAYDAFISYFKSNDTLPSIAYYDDALKTLASNYLNAVLDELKQFTDGKTLTKEQSEIFRIGTLLYPSKENIIYSSVHPINVAYQFALSFEGCGTEIREDILKKLTSDNLIPFIHDSNGRLFKVQEQLHTPFWTYYCPEDRVKYKGAGKFVANLVSEKIRDFYDHFTYLFDGIGGNKLIINAVNMGDCYNIFNGIINYYKSQIVKNPAGALSIDINVYNEDRVYNVFEVLSRKSALKTVLSEMGIREDAKEYSESEFINLIMQKVSYYRKNINAQKYDYCHLAFIEMDNDSKIDFSNKNDIRSGTMLNGLLSGVTSMYYGGNQSYCTGYGSQFNLQENQNNILLNLVECYNSAMLVYGKSSPYNSQNAICTYIDDKETEVINKTYDSSNWVVFVEPKVDLNFFKNEKRDIMIIHYSDQHTTSSGYDAITVTKKTEQYENILREYLVNNGMSAGERDQIRRMIDMFNAVNGDWLLKLISSKNSFSKEKISVQSAIKLALAFFKNDNIIWIPISLEEILRVSGSVGLKEDGGLFSAKKLGYSGGATSDDLLLFGVEVSDGKVLVHLYPLEVKIGYKSNDEIEKAQKQIRHTREIFDNALINADNNLQTKVYRNFFAQLAVISAEKLDLYKVWTGQNWERIVNSEIRGRLLNDDFIFTDSLKSAIGDGVIISFKEDSFMRSVSDADGITVIKFLYSDGINYIAKSVDDICNDIQKMDDVKSFRENKAFTVARTLSISSDATVSDGINLAESEELMPIKPIVAFDSPGMKEPVCVPNNTVSEQVKESEVSDIEEQAISKSPDGMRILFGNDANDGTPLYWYPNDTEKIMHPNTGIIGTMGTGKTQFTKSLILQLVREQHNNPGDSPLGILIFDYKGDYIKEDFREATNAKVYDLYHLPFNPFSLTVTDNSKLLPLRVADGFIDTLSRCYPLGAKQKSFLSDCIAHAYEIKGIDKADRCTWSKLPPTFDTVFKIYSESEGFKEDSLYAALSKLQRYEMFESDAAKTIPLFDLLNGITVINLSGETTSIQNLIVAITLDLFYSQMQVNGHSRIDGKLRQLTKFILVDEADNFLKEGFPSLRKILKEGREFGVGTILSTQFLKHFDTQDDDFAKYIYTWIIHNVDDLSTKDVKNLFNTTSKSQEEELFSGIKRLNKHYSIVKFGGLSNPYYIRDKAFWELLEETKNEEAVVAR